MPTARASLGAATGLDGRVYAIGGNDGGTFFNTVEVYTPSSNSWATVAPMPTARYALAVAAGLDGRIYAIGGYNGSDLTTVEAYAPGSDTWTTLASMPGPGRDGLAAATGPDGRIYIVGGYSGGTFFDIVAAYTPSTNSWATVASMSTARAGAGATTGPDGRIYAIGGETWGGTALNTVEAYTPCTNSWATVAPMPTARRNLAAATGPDGHIYALGGYNGSYLKTVEAYDTGFSTTGSFSGTVTDASTHCGIYRIQVTAWTLGGVSEGTIYTASNGSYSYPTLTPGSYKVSFSDARGGYATQWWYNQPSQGAGNPVAVSSGNNTSGVYAAMNGSGTLTATTAPVVQGLRVYVFDLNDNPVAAAVTDSTGTVHIPRLFGDYKVEVLDPAHNYLTTWYQQQSSFANATPVSVPTAGTSITVVIQHK